MKKVFQETFFSPGKQALIRRVAQEVMHKFFCFVTRIDVGRRVVKSCAIIRSEIQRRP